MTTLLIDGDYIVYAAGFAGQKTEYLATVEGGYVTGSNKTEIAQQIYGPEAKPSQLDADETVHVYARTIVDPLENVLHTVKQMIATEVAECQQKGYELDDVMIFIDGDGNFRNKLWTIKPYKGTRMAPKPVLYPDIREYLAKRGAITVYDQESDDAIAILATRLQEKGETVIICGVDKDLLQIPAIHKNPLKGWRRVTPAQGQLALYRQCLTGDPVDNIGGCYKCGPKKAEKLLPSEDMPAEEMWAIVLKAYDDSIRTYGPDTCGYDNAKAAAIENMRLVYLRRKYDELWEPPYE